MSVYPEAYIQYIKHFHGSRDFFECHEVLEEYWKKEPDSPFHHLWVGLIQIAVALYHQRRGNVRGALKMMSSAVDKLRNEELSDLGIDQKLLIEQLEQRLTLLKERPDESYRDMDIPVIDSELSKLIKKAKEEVFDPFVINKHTERDRSEVIKTREAELIKRKAAQPGSST